jgi:hypothetical protein
MHAAGPEIPVGPLAASTVLPGNVRPTGGDNQVSRSMLVET